MGDLRRQFSRFYEPTDRERRAALKGGLVVMDTNVLLSLYRFTSNARDQLFAVLEKLANRLWVPYQVGLEFHQKRLTVIAEQESASARVREELATASSEYEKLVSTFANRVALAPTVTQEILGGLRDAFAAADEKLAKMVEKRPVHLSEHNRDPVLTRLEQVLDGRVGEALAAEELAAAKTEAERRVAEKIPPGYMDRGKPDPTGDYIIWLELKKEAARRQVPVVLVTDDKKEDWFRRDRGLTLGPRVELYAELEQESGVQLHLLTSETFLLLSQKYLEAEVSPATVDEAKSLPTSQLDEVRLRSAEANREMAALQRRRHEVHRIVLDAAKRRDEASKRLETLLRQSKAHQADDRLFDEIHATLEWRDRARAELKEARLRREELNRRLKKVRRVAAGDTSEIDWEQFEASELMSLSEDDEDSDGEE